MRYYWQRGRFALSLLLIIAVGGSVLGLSAWLLGAITAFIALKFDSILTVFSVAIVAVYLWKTRHEERQARMQEIKEQQAAQAAEVERAVAENNYNIMRQCLFSVLAEKAAIIGLVKPSTLSEMNSPSRIIPRNGFVLCQFVAMKQGAEVDLKLIKECLQMRIIQKLNAGEFAELTAQNHVYNGRAYPILYIDEILDTGGNLQINTAFVNDAYCQYLETKMYAQQQNTVQSPTVPRDTDF